MHKARAFFFVCAALLCLAGALPRSAAAAGPTNPPANVPLSTANGSQYTPTIVSDGVGGAIVAWRDTRNFAPSGIYGQRIAADGALQWTADGVALGTVQNGDQASKIVTDDASGAIVAWSDSRSGNSVIYAQRTSAAGTSQWAANGVALCTADGSRYNPSITSDGAGGAIVAWSDFRNFAPSDIYAQRVSAAGMVQWTADGVALSAATGGQWNPTITSDGAGGAIVTWTDYRSGYPNSDIYAQRISAGGTVQWTTDGVALCTAPGGQGDHTIVSDGAGGAIVAWTDGRSGTFDIYAQRISASGTVQWAANGVALCTATGSQQSTGIAADDAGGAIVTWTDSRSGSTSDIYAQRISAEGTPQWMADGATLCAATGAQQSPAIVADGEGGAIVAWYGSGINAQRISAAGAVQWAANGVAVCATAGYNPTIAADGEGGANVVWADTRGGSSVIYAQRVSAGGAVQWTTDGVALGPAPTTAVVPDDFPTIQAGIDSGRDTVLVRSGRYDEDLVLVAGVTLAAIPSGAGTDTVVTGGLSITQPTDGRPWPDRTLIDVRGIHFAGRVRAEPAPRQYAYQIAFAACRMDSSLSLNALFVEHVSVDHCTILNGSSISTTGGSASLTHNTVLGGGIYVHNDGGEYTIRGNYVHGPAGYGIRAFMDSGGLLDSNTVIGVGVGVYVWGGSAWVHDNTVMECSGSGIVSSWDGNRIEGNLVQNCGGFGIDATSSRVALVGPNTILACQTGGIRLQAGYGWLVGNVVGRCGGPGMEGGGQVERNTCYLNSGPGFKIATANTSITNNIAFSNSGPGLQWTGSDAPTLACNDWFGNTGGATVGTLPGPTDSSMAPLFCDFTMDDVHLSAGSALLDASGCGLIGALGRGCSVPVGESLVRALTASPNPSRGSVRFSWPISPRPDRLEVLDVTGARRWSAPIAGWICTLRWPGVDRDGTRLAAGVYYARLMGNGASATARFVLVQ